MTGSTKSGRNPGPGKAWGLLVALVFVSLVGLGLSIYLSVLHWNVHCQPGYESFCAVSEEVNCDTVALSKYSMVASVPISSWGMLFYSLMAILGVWGFFVRRPPWPWALAGLLNAAAMGAAAFLFLASELIIHSFCIVCMALYAVNVLSALVCILGQRRAGLPPSTAASLPLGGLLLGTLGFVVDSPQTLQQGWPGVAALAGLSLIALAGLNLRRGLVHAKRWAEGLVQDLTLPFSRPLTGAGLSLLAAGAAVAVLVGSPMLYPESSNEIAGGIEDIGHGRTHQGHAWIGAEHPEVTIVEYSDYECPVCRMAHEIVRQVVRKNKDWLRLVHVHMPLDQACNPRLGRPFHRHACECALATVCADEQGAFWPMNDQMFIRRCGLDSGGLTELAVLAENMGLDAEAFRDCMKSARARRALAGNLAECRRLRLKLATPIFRLGDRVLMGLMNKDRSPRDQKWWIRETARLRKSAAISRPGT